MAKRTKAEILRYLGHKGQTVPESLDNLIDQSLAEMRAVARLRTVHAEYPLHWGEDSPELEGAGIPLPGEAIRRHLAGCGRAVLLAATLGVEADSLIRRWERSDLTRSLVLDACATQLIEEGCDEWEGKLREAVRQEGLEATGRFSPGYGDLPLTLQPRLLAAVNAGRRIGLTCTDSLILLPRKSVTAIVGLGRGLEHQGGRGCQSCPLRERCPYRKESSNGCPNATHQRLSSL